VFERGDLVLIPFPFSDLSPAKRRPVLLLTRPDAYGDFVALAVTSPPQIIGRLAPARGRRE
jgi:mRNA interferase MazF